MFKALINDLVQTAFNTVGDLKDVVNYVQIVSTSYNTERSEPEYTFDYDIGIQALFTKFSQEEATDEVRVLTDRKVLIPATQITLSLKQAVDDMIIDGTGKQWNVRKYLGVAGGSLHTFHVRAA